MSKTIKPVVEIEEIIPSEKYWKIKGTDSQGKDFSYRVFADLTGPMNLETQLPEFYEQQKQKGNPTPANSIQIFNIMDHAVTSKNASLINHLHTTFRRNYIRALSVASYSSIKSENRIIHNYNTSDEFFEQGIILGPDGNVNNLNLKQRKALDLILKQKDLRILNKVSQAINQTPFYLWRLNSNLSEKIQRGVGFDADANGFSVDADWDLSDSDPAVRVLREK